MNAMNGSRRWHASPPKTCKAGHRLSGTPAARCAWPLQGANAPSPWAPRTEAKPPLEQRSPLVAAVVGLAVVFFVERLVFRHDCLRRRIGGQFEIFAVAGRLDGEYRGLDLLARIQAVLLVAVFMALQGDDKFAPERLHPGRPLVFPAPPWHGLGNADGNRDFLHLAHGSLLLGAEFPLDVPARPAGIVNAAGPDRSLLIELRRQHGCRRAVDVVITCVQAYQRLAGNRRGRHQQSHGPHEHYPAHSWTLLGSTPQGGKPCGS